MRMNQAGFPKPKQTPTPKNGGTKNGGKKQGGGKKDGGKKPC